MELPRAHRLAVERLTDLLPVTEVNWALTGSVAHRLQGANLGCRDIDVQTDQAGAYDVATRLQKWVVEPVALRTSARVQSHFGQLRFEDLGLDVEVMGALQKLTVDGVWDVPTDPAEHRVFVVMGPKRVPVLSLDYEAEAYDLLGRHDRAET
ncbi:MAG: hypothetical protein LC749_08315, partial [Actinobacteria bacterium]|nr:hypothetical protein [Actinomycetota bacterium]